MWGFFGHKKGSAKNGIIRLTTKRLSKIDKTMKLSKHELELLKESLGYGVMNSRSESETAEFVLLRLKVEKQMTQECSFCGGSRFHRNDQMEFVACEACENTK